MGLSSNIFYFLAVKTELLHLSRDYHCQRDCCVCTEGHAPRWGGLCPTVGERLFSWLWGTLLMLWCPDLNLCWPQGSAWRNLHSYIVTSSCCSPDWWKAFGHRSLLHSCLKGQHYLFLELPGICSEEYLSFHTGITKLRHGQCEKERLYVYSPCLYLPYLRHPCRSGPRRLKLESHFWVHMICDYDIILCVSCFIGYTVDYLCFFTVYWYYCHCLTLQAMLPELTSLFTTLLIQLK